MCRCPIPLIRLSFFDSSYRTARTTGSSTRRGAAGDSIGYLNPGHTQFKQNILEQGLLAVAKIAFGLFLENVEGINGLPCAHNIHAGWLAFSANGAELNQSGHIKRFDQTFKSHLCRSALSAACCKQFL